MVREPLRGVVVVGGLGIVSGLIIACLGGKHVTANRGCVQHLPVWTHLLQNPHSPSLQISHFQKQSLENESTWNRIAPLANV